MQTIHLQHEVILILIKTMSLHGKIEVMMLYYHQKKRIHLLGLLKTEYLFDIQELMIQILEQLISTEDFRLLMRKKHVL
jgi:hypothetical protein